MSARLRNRSAAVVLTAGIVALSLVTGYIHLTLGTTSSLLGLLFLANAAGYVALAFAMVAVNTVRLPLVQRFSWVPRAGLAAFTALTIVGYLAVGPYFLLGWLTKAVELGILVLLALDMVRLYGSPIGLLRTAWASLRRSPRPEAARA